MCILLSVAVISGAVRAATWYVDAGNYGKSGLDGSAENPYGTIQDAVDAAASGDVIKVAPGLYNQGEQSASGGITTLSRVQIVDKALTLEATGAKADTIIEGKSAATESGLGTGAVRCLLFSGNVTTNSVVRGFTLRGGRTLSATEATTDSVSNSGGAVMGDWQTAVVTPARATLIDCDIIDCGATRGGAIRCVDAIRCRFIRCFATKNGGAGRNCAAYNCLFAHTYRVGTATMSALDFTQTAVNCTFVDNDMRAVNATANGNGLTYNSYVGFVGGDGVAFSANTVDKQGVFIFNCVAPSDAVNSTYRVLAENCTWTTDQLQLLSPATEDYRPLASADETMMIASAANYRAQFPARFAAEADKDLDGAPRFDADGTLCVGAYQTSSTPASAFVYLANVANSSDAQQVVVNAHTSQVVSAKTYLCTYLTTPTWPATVEVEFIPAATTAESKDLFGVEYRNSSFSSFKFPRRGENGFVMMPGPVAVKNTYLYPNYGERRYVNPTTGVDATADNQGLSAAKPWKTLQFAADNAPEGAVIHAAAGDYTEGDKQESDDVKSRVSIAKRIRFVADEGPEATRIVGAVDPNASAKDVGCGPAAVRCVRIAMDSHGCVQGFSLYNGHTITNSTSGAGWGGGFCVSNYNNRKGYLVDSVVTNCSGSRGVIYSGTVARCRVVDNDLENNGNGVIRGALLVSSVIAGNTSQKKNGNSSDIGQDNVAVNCVVDTSRNLYSLHKKVDLINTIVDGGKIPSDGVRTFAGTLLSTKTEQQAAYPADAYADPCFVDKAAGDYRVYSYSPAARTFGTNDYTLASAWQGVTGDYEGRTLVFKADGAPIVGAYQSVVAVRALTVEATGAGAEGATVTPQGLVTLTDDEPVTVTTAGSARPCIGLEINGVFHKGLTQTTIDPKNVGLGETVTIRAVFSTDWYVDAENGNDENTGWSSDAAMKTLAGVMAKTRAGDTVHALPGVYNEGSALQDGVFLNDTSKGWGEAPIPARVVVQTNVALVATGTAENTVIEGALGTLRSDRATGSTSTYEAYALGTNAVRCVYLNDGSSVRGFTLRNGRLNASNAQDDNGYGAGVLCRTRDKGEVVDCVISNCACWRGSAGIYAKFRRCRLVENKTPGNSSAGRYCSYYGCYIARNQDYRGQYGGVVGNIGDFVGNTIAADNYATTDKTKGLRAIISQDTATPAYRFWNNVILQPYSAADAAKYPSATLKNAYHNFFATEANFPAPTSGDHNDLSRSVAELKIGADGVPACDSPVVDAGDFEYAATNLVGEVDLNGVPRGRNGNRIDVGAFEQPWLARYTQDIGGRRLTVTAADCAVVENAEQKVEIPSGGVSLTWQPLVRGDSIEAVVSLQVTGNGTLGVYKDGQLAQTFGNGTWDWKFTASAGETYALDFVYEPGADDTGAAIICSAKAIRGICLVVR